MTPGDLFPSAGDGSEGSDEPQRLATPDLEDAGEILQRWGWGKGSSTIQICIYIYIYLDTHTHMHTHTHIYIYMLWVSKIYNYIYYIGFKDPTIPV